MLCLVAKGVGPIGFLLQLSLFIHGLLFFVLREMIPVGRELGGQLADVDIFVV